MMKQAIKFLGFCVLLFVSTFSYAAKISSVAFYYGSNPPIDELHAFNVAVVDPTQKIILPQKYNTKNSQLYAYVSVGEVDKYKSYYGKVNQDWVIGENKIWQSDVLDQSSPAWRKFFVNQIITPLWNQGYRGFFFDTLDSFRLAATTKQQQLQQQTGLIKLIKAVKAKYPQAHLICNRGFEILPEIHKLVDAVAVESLFSGWNQKDKKYEPVTKENRDELLKKLNEIKKYNLPIISIDYVNPADRAKAREVAKKIEALDFIPWVADGDLSSLGVGSIEVMPRKILMLYDDEEAERLMALNVVACASMPLEYMGYRPVLYDVRQQQLPAEILAGRYAGIVVWINGDYNKKLQDWLIKQKQMHVPIMILGSLGQTTEKKFQKSFGLLIDIKNSVDRVTIIHKAPMVGYEVTVFPATHEFFPIKNKEGTALLTLRSSNGQIADMIALTPWGGYALNPFVLMQLPNNQTRWIINPLQFFPKALQLKLNLIPDVTSENGKRLMMVHVDGDSFISRAEWKMQWLAGEAMLKEIFERYKIPTTVSIIQGEIAANGLYPKLSKEAEDIARKIFRLPWVEIASHSYSHPFLWPGTKYSIQQMQVTGEKKLYKQWYLPIKNYKFNLQTEITGSVDYINRQLAPRNKRCKVFLWTGACNPDAQALAMTYRDGLFNMNGGGWVITDDQKSLTNIPPLGIYREQYFQTFAPNQNENIYTNNWSGPFYGYRRAIESFKLTNAPFRFKPIDVYYHFFSATKTASLASLKKVYDWALTQSVNNIYVSEYVRKVLDFNHMVIAKQKDGWLVTGNGDLRELRVPQSLGYPDLKRSKNVVGYSSYGEDYYVHLGDAKQSLLYFTNKKPSLPYIKYANGVVGNFKRNGNDMRFTLKSYVPLKFTLANMRGCVLYRGRGWIMQGKKQDGAMTFTASANTEHKLTVNCKSFQWW
ncbi:MAG: endo alpha-1,4 polygalactosaminidase [Gammaproteobacteria bacterium]